MIPGNTTDYFQEFKVVFEYLRIKIQESRPLNLTLFGYRIGEVTVTVEYDGYQFEKMMIDEVEFSNFRMYPVFKLHQTVIHDIYIHIIDERKNLVPETA